MRSAYKSNSARCKSQRGMSLVELMIAMVILTIGICALLGLIVTAINNNNRTKQDTGGTLAAQMVIETIAAQPSNDPGLLIPITDCTGVTTNMKVASGNGAQLNASGAIDFAGQSYAAAPDNYKMKYTSCGAANTRVVYDVRWNIQTLTPYSKLVTVSARPANAEGLDNTSNGALRFQRPITLKTIAVQGN